MYFKLIILFIGLVPINAAPITPEPIHILEPINKAGVADVLTLIPGLHKNEICSMCKRILSAFKKDTLGRAHQDQSELRAFVDQECHALTSVSLSYLSFESLEPFCREMGNSLMDFASQYSQLAAGFVDPVRHCEVATFCEVRDE